MALRCALITEPRPLATASPRRKTASGGLKPILHHRLSRWPSQTHAAPWKNRLRYDLARRGAVLPQRVQKKVDCSSGARQLVNFANDVALGAGGSALVFGALGMEPVAAALTGGAGVADGLSFIAGGYVYLTEGDSDPLKSSFVGAALGAAGGFSAPAEDVADVTNGYNYAARGYGGEVVPPSWTGLRLS